MFFSFLFTAKTDIAFCNLQKRNGIRVLLKLLLSTVESKIKIKTKDLESDQMLWIMLN